MTRSEAFALARKRVQETGKPWLVCISKQNRRADLYWIQSGYDEKKSHVEMCAWISVNGSERVYDGQEAPAEASGGAR